MFKILLCPSPLLMMYDFDKGLIRMQILHSFTVNIQYKNNLSKQVTFMAPMFCIRPIRNI